MTDEVDSCHMHPHMLKPSQPAFCSPILQSVLFSKIKKFLKTALLKNWKAFLLSQRFVDNILASAICSAPPGLHNALFYVAMKRTLFMGFWSANHTLPSKQSLARFHYHSFLLTCCWCFSFSLMFFSQSSLWLDTYFNAFSGFP